MIRKSKQSWAIGSTVKVGFLTLKVISVRATPGDGLPDAYLLERSGKYYEFIPHNGLTAISADESLRLFDFDKY